MPRKPTGKPPGRPRSRVKMVLLVTRVYPAQLDHYYRIGAEGLRDLLQADMNQELADVIQAERGRRR